MGRVSAVFFFTLLLALSAGVQQLLVGSLPANVAIGRVAMAKVAGPGPRVSSAHPVSLAQPQGVRVAGAAKMAFDNSRLPDGGVIYNRLGAWLTDTPQGKPELLDRGPVPRNSLLLPILMYHHVRPIDFKTSNRFVSELTLPPAEFEQELRYLKNRGIATVSMEDLYRYFQGEEDLPAHAVVLSFDDGYLDNYQYALPLLRQFGAKGTFFIATGFTGQKDYMTWADLKEMVAAGMEIGDHTISHVDLRIVSPAVREKELTQSKRTLEEKLGVAVRALSYPGGAFNAGVIAAATNAGYVSAVTTRYGALHSRSKIMELSRVRISGRDTLPSFRWKIEQFFPMKASGSK